MNMRIANAGRIDLKAEASGRWAHIISTLYPQIAGALTVPGVARCTCPIHGTSKRKGDGFRVLNDFHSTGGAVCNTCGVFPSGIDLIMFLEQTDNVGRAFEVLRGYFGISNVSDDAIPRKLSPRIEAPKGPSENEISQRIKILARIWEESTPLKDLPDNHQAIRYFKETRGIGSIDLIKQQRFLRFHKELFFCRSERKDEPPTCFPAIVSMMHGADGRPVGIHRTFLGHAKPDKAPVERPKKILKRAEIVLNGSIRLDSVMGLTAHANVVEGIENGMSIAFSTGRSVYVAGYATLLSVWQPTPGTRFVTIWCDRDANEAGLRNASKLQARMHEMGIKTRILVPRHMNAADEDWNDVLINQGHEAIADAYSGTSSSTDYL